MAGRDDGDWLEFVAELMREPLTELPVERVSRMLRDTFDGGAVTHNVVAADGAVTGALYPLDASLEGHRADMVAWGTGHARSNPLARYYAGTGAGAVMQLADVPRPFSDLRVYGEGAALAEDCGVPHQLALPGGRSVLVVGRPRVYAEAELRLAGRIQRLLQGLERQATAYAGALRSARSERVAASVELTPRERGVLGLLAEGHTAGAIARRLGIAERTVHKHLERCYSKLGVADRLSAVLQAQRLGLVAAA
jgi:DNA-binding CsgD family transcriptional regulator